MFTSKDSSTLPASSVLWAFCALTIAIAPHSTRFSGWLMLSFFALASWRVLGAYQWLPLPDRKNIGIWLLKQIVAVAIFVATYWSFNGQLGRDAGVAMLTALLGLKMLEMQSQRDFYIVMFLGYFLVVTNLFYSQTILTATYMVAVVLIVTAGLIHFNGIAGGITYGRCFRLAGQYIAQAIPLMIAAFFLFPRIPGPLWGVPQDFNEGITGLSNDMTIGNISRLGVSDEIAFRVAFEGAEPPARERYWRGPVLWHTDGRTWRGGTIGNGAPRQPLINGPAYTYEIMLEPHGEKWVFGLEATIASDDELSLSSDHRLLANRRINRRTRYRITAATDYRLDTLTVLERVAALALPDGFHPRARELAEQWREQHASEQAVIDSALNMFNQQPYVYTLVPKPLGNDTIDSFLFETREGFCEYFASSFVVLMRAAGIPARVVTGYQGGEFNTMSDFMVIRQRDAHAWAEVFLDGEGWVRVDPTAAVAPERVSLGIDDVLSSRAAFAVLREDNPIGLAFRHARDMWDAVNFNWSQWVLGYSPKRQRQLLDDWGFDSWNYGGLIAALTVAAAVILGLVAWATLGRSAGNQDEVAVLYQRFCRKLARAGFHRGAAEGPWDYARRVAQEREDLAEQVFAITETYAALRYAGKNIALEEFAGLIKRFNITTVKPA